MKYVYLTTRKGSDRKFHEKDCGLRSDTRTKKVTLLYAQNHFEPCSFCEPHKTIEELED